MATLDIITITHGHMELTIRCVKALYKHTISPFHLIVIDDSTPDMDEGTDMTPEWFGEFLKTHDNVSYIHSDEPYKNSVQIFTEALRHCVTPYAAVVVNSMIVEPEWDIAGLQMMRMNPKIGMIGFKSLRYGTELIESAGLASTVDGASFTDIGRGQSGHRFSKAYEVDVIQWAFCLLRLEAVRDNLGEPVYNGFKGCEEFETCLTMREKGWKIFYCGLGVGYHQTLATRIAKGPDDLILNLQNKEIMYKRWGLWPKYHQLNPGAGEFFPDMEVRDRLPPVLIIDHTGVISQKVERTFQEVSA